MLSCSRTCCATSLDLRFRQRLHQYCSIACCNPANCPPAAVTAPSARCLVPRRHRVLIRKRSPQYFRQTALECYRVRIIQSNVAIGCHFNTLIHSHTLGSTSRSIEKERKREKRAGPDHFLLSARGLVAATLKEVPALALGSPLDIETEVRCPRNVTSRRL